MNRAIWISSILMLFLLFIGYSIGFPVNKQEIEMPNAPMMVIASSSPEVPSPKDRIKPTQIHVYKDEIVIDLENAEWATFPNTNSMDPLFDAGSNAIEIVPRSPQEIQVGDIVSYETEFGTIIHRIIEVGQDEEGWYAIFQGDNNPIPDPERVRWSQIRRVIVAIIY